MNSLQQALTLFKCFTKSGKEFVLPDYRRRQRPNPQMGVSYSPLPENFLEEFTKIDINLNFPQLMNQQKLLLAMYQTSRLDRSASQGMILLVGTTGVGKSSVINHLFNISEETWKTFADISDSSSQTDAVKEYFLTVDSHAYQVKDLKLGFIDTPGFQDTRYGNLGDARNLKMLQIFFEKHPCLRGKCPNLIFMCISADDVRYEGETSNFVKSLRCLKELNLVDLDKPNLIVVITKCCKMSPNYRISEKKCELWRDNIEVMKTRLNNLILRELDIEVEIAILENNYLEEELERPKLKDLTPSDFTVLPNDELQPYNLFESCLRTMQANNDLFGEIIFHACFLDGWKATPQSGFEVSFRDIPADASLSAEMNFIEQMEGDSDFLTHEVRKFFRENNLTDQEKNAIFRLKNQLKKMGVFQKEDLLLITQEAIKFHFSENTTPITQSFIQDYLQIRSDERTTQLNDIILYGFNILNDRVVQNSCFDMSLTNQNYGLQIPYGCSLVKVYDEEKEKEVSMVFSNKKEMILYRLEELNLSSDEIDTTKFKYQTRTGCVIDDGANTHLSCLHEYRLFRIDCQSINGQSISENFRKAVESLPDIFEETDADCGREFSDFFTKWGHYVIVSVYVGGYWVRKMKVKDASDLNDLQLEDIDVKFYGGYAEGINPQNLEDKRKLKQWSQLLILNPIILKTNFNLNPIYDVVKLVDVNKSKALFKAFTFITSFRLNTPIKDNRRSHNRSNDPNIDSPLTRLAAVEKHDLDLIGRFKSAWNKLRNSILSPFRWLKGLFTQR